MRILLSASLLLLPHLATADAQEAHYLKDAQFTYEVFETAVEHADLETCPADFDANVVFCRLTLSADQAHVFAFSYDGDSPLVAVKAYDLGEDFLPF